MLLLAGTTEPASRRFVYTCHTKFRFLAQLVFLNSVSKDLDLTLVTTDEANRMRGGKEHMARDESIFIPKATVIMLYVNTP